MRRGQIWSWKNLVRFSQHGPEKFGGFFWRKGRTIHGAEEKKIGHFFTNFSQKKQHPEISGGIFLHQIFYTPG